MYQIIKNVITRRDFDLSAILWKVNTLWAEEKLTDEQRNELVSLARSAANIVGSVDVHKKLLELEQRIRALEGGETAADTISDYIAGKYYYNGDKVLFDQNTYICTAPEGTVCVWSPAEYPTYWEAVS